PRRMTSPGITDRALTGARPLSERRKKLLSSCPSYSPTIAHMLWSWGWPRILGGRVTFKMVSWCERCITSMPDDGLKAAPTSGGRPHPPHQRPFPHGARPPRLRAIQTVDNETIAIEHRGSPLGRAGHDSAYCRVGTAGATNATRRAGANKRLRSPDLPNR